MIRQHCLRDCFPFLAASLLVIAFHAESRGSISYTAINSTYTQDFNTLPQSPSTFGNSPAGWTDDSTSPGSNFSIPGWYLYHSTSQTEGGFNGHQRFRTGTGNSGTGSFYSFGVGGTNDISDRALGDVTSSTISTSYFALRLTNNTGGDLSQFTLSYTGEQWRDGGATTPNAQTMTFDYVITAAAPTNISALSGTAVPALNFTSPTFTNTGSGAALDGNAAANRTALSTTVGGFVWAAGQDLWLRWRDGDDTGNDHGLAFDDLTFSAATAPEINSVANGLASVGSTWSDGQPAGIGKGYHVVGGNTVTLDGPFTGSKLSVENGTANINAGGNGQEFGAVTVEAGGNLTESVTGDVSIGGSSTGSSLKLNRNVAFNLDANENFHLKATLSGTGNLDFNEATPGAAANAQVFLDATTASTGTIHFNAGQQVNVTESAGAGIVEMNSTQAGGNIFNFAPKVAGTVVKMTFNQPGTFIHATNNPSGTAGQRLQNITTLVANAAVTFDLSQPLAIEERRLQISAFQGSGNITVVGTPTDPTNASSPSTGVTLNEFEVGAQTTDPTAGSSEPYSGTISTQDFINVEIRRNLPSAKLVVNQNGRLETGAQAIPLTNNAGTTLGEVQVNNGGVLEVGFEQANAVSGTFTEGHHANHLVLASTAGRAGSLTMASGSTLRMQINGTDQSAQYDYINANGNVSLNGTLDVLVNPVSCTGNDPCGANVNPTWSPTVGDTFNIINLTAAIPAGDYDQNGVINAADYTAWRSTFGNTITAGTGADGNKDGVIDAADYVLWRSNVGALPSMGTLSGTFANINVVDPTGVMSGLGFQTIYTATGLQLIVVAAGSGASLGGAAVPEPTTLALLGSIFTLLSLTRRR
ncbi:MAG TPA: PEP-CTERM sorting domain-containing protein [Lacipirellulaceae bacterium]|nr:PEP-CTERM sorting domain-containing protein [Lacipirellulaceae bacterium]